MMDDFDATFSTSTSTPCLGVRITRTEEQMSIMMQRFTAYVIEIDDFGRVCEVSHRYSDFETLHKALMMECPAVQLPPMPPKGADGTDAAVIAARKVDLEKVLKSMITNSEALMEKSLLLWKFLELGNPTVIASRFVMVPRARPTVFKTLSKLTDEKYKADVYRLGHPSVTDLLLEGLRELRRGEGSHWAAQSGGRLPLCQLVAGALGTSQAARDRLVDGGVIGLLLGVVQNEENALDDVRPALNVVVAREGERLPALVAQFLNRGGLVQLLDLVQRARCQEFVAKLLWLAWDAATRSAFAQPGSVGLKVLQTLLRSSTPSCSLLGAVLLAGMVAGGDFHDTHRSEALKMVHGTLDRPEAAKDPQFGKALLGGASSLARLAAMLEDVDLAPLVLGLLCAAKPPGAKLGQISGNLAALISNKGVPHSEQTRARAAELLLHIQGGEGEVSRSDGREVTSSAQVPKSSINDLLERCEGIAAHEESMEAALRSQLEEGIAKGLQALEPHAENVAQAKDVARQRLQDLPSVDFKSFESSFQMLRSAREALASHVKKCESLHENIDRQLKDLQRARPNVDPHVFKEKLLAAEQLYSEVKSQREASSTAEADAKEKTSKAQASTARMKTLNDELRRYDQELHELRAERKDKETKAALLRSKANTPGLEDRKKQVQEDIDRNLEEAREMQVIGRRVQQGEDGYLSEGQSRDSKIAELTTKLNELKRHHQQLLQKQKELDIDPVALGDQASRLENEASELDLRIGNLEDRQREAERNRIEASGDATRESEDARSARDHASHLASRLSSVERDAKAQLSALQPMIQEQHAGWQRLLAKQRNLDEDQYNLGLKLLETKHAAESEARSRQQVAGIVQDVVKSLLSFAQTLESCGEAPQAAPTGAQAVAQAPLADEFDDFLQQDSVRDPFGGAEPDPFGGDDEEDPFAVTAVPRSNPSPTHREEEVFAGESFEGV